MEWSQHCWPFVGVMQRSSYHEGSSTLMSCLLPLASCLINSRVAGNPNAFGTRFVMDTSRVNVCIFIEFLLSLKIASRH